MYVFLLIFAVLFAVVAVAFALLWRRPERLGFRGKTLWDWIQLLLIPGMVGLGGVAISATQYLVERDRAKEEALRTYFDRITALVLNPSGLDDPGIKAIGRAQTLAVLREVEGERAGRVLGFLSDLELLGALDIEFEGLDLRSAELKRMSLSGIDFESVDLTDADLEGTLLSGVDFENASLAGADLKGADLSNAQFEGAELGGADLDHANLRGADLTLALDLTSKQLAEACIDATTKLPAGLALPALPSAGCSGTTPDD